METLQELFAFMRKHSFKKASWDNELIIEDDEGRWQLIDFEDRQEKAIVKQWNAVSERMLAKFGDRTSKPLWFHV